MTYQINAAIQVLPQIADNLVYSIVDEAIEEIKKSGMRYLVCPFETVVEGDYDEVIALIARIRDRCLNEGANELLINIKIQVRKGGPVTMEEKIGKYTE